MGDNTTASDDDDDDDAMIRTVLHAPFLTLTKKS